MSPEHVAVRIFGETYPLRTDQDSAYVEEIARHVDTRMREVAASGKVVVTSKIAVLAALHIADELHRLRRSLQTRADGEETDRRILALVDSLERALTPPAPR